MNPTNGAFSGRTIVVTGGISGMGRATVELLRERGAGVAVIDWKAPEAGKELERATGATVFDADVSREEEMVRAFEAIDSRFERVDGLFSNAGIARTEGLIHEESAESWDEVIGVNLRGTFLAVREAVKRMVAHGRGGAIVCTSSAVAEAAIPGGTNAYTASKGGINALVRQVAVDYAGRNIRINAVAPGAVDTPLMWDTTPPDSVKAMRSTIDSEVPLGKIGRPIDVAHAVAWLLSDEAAYVTGAVYLVDGGVSARLPLSV
jgi:NAD(P)-dependent dehydrogenase (short-subunit alcohol dehydrogenase family)